MSEKYIYRAKEKTVAIILMKIYYYILILSLTNLIIKYFTFTGIH